MEVWMSRGREWRRRIWRERGWMSRGRGWRRRGGEDGGEDG